MGSWRDFWEWLKPESVQLAEARTALTDALDENDRLRKENGRLKKHVARLEGQAETSRGKEEAERQRAKLLADQARRCKCRS